MWLDARGRSASLCRPMVPDPAKRDVDELVSAHLGLASAIARRMQQQSGAPRALRADLEAAAWEGLVDAARRFDSSRGVPFAAYATIRVRGAVTDWLRREGTLSRRAYAKLTGLEGAWRVADALEHDGAGTARDLDALLADHLATMATALALGLHATPDDAPRAAAASEELDEPPDVRFERHQTREVLRAALAGLDEPGRSLLERHYFAGEELGEIARAAGHSPSWASRVHASSLAALSRLLGARDRHAW